MSLHEPIASPRRPDVPVATSRFQRVSRLSLLDADTDFARDIPAEDRTLARRVLVLPSLTVAAGQWPEMDAADDDAVRLLVVSGVVAAGTVVADRTGTQLFGSGDVICPRPPGAEAVPSEVHWRALREATLVVLDTRFTMAARRWPSLSGVVHERLLRQLERSAAQTVIGHLPRVEQRILAILWQLADTFGVVTPAGVVVPLHLTHELIGQLVGARRPTVTLALSVLARDGLLHRDGDGHWLLGEHSRDDLFPSAFALAG